jgi:hypothetical protein
LFLSKEGTIVHRYYNTVESLAILYTENEKSTKGGGKGA